MATIVYEAWESVHSWEVIGTSGSNKYLLSTREVDTQIPTAVMGGGQPSVGVEHFYSTENGVFIEAEDEEGSLFWNPVDSETTKVLLLTNLTIAAVANGGMLPTTIDNT